jgi:hypothetical protein
VWNDGQPTAEGRGVGRHRRFDPGGVESRADESVDRVAQPDRIGDGRGFRRPRGLEAPPGGPLRELPFPDRLRGCFDHPRIGCAPPHPIDQNLHLFGGNRTVGGHLQVGIGSTNGFDEERFVGRAGNDRRPLIPTASPSAPRVEREAPFDLLVMRMALVAASLEHREDGVGEEPLVGHGGVGNLGGATPCPVKDAEQCDEGRRHQKTDDDMGERSHHGPPGGGTASLANEIADFPSCDV